MKFFKALIGLTFFIFVFFTPIETGSCSNLSGFITMTNDEIEPELRDKILGIKDELITHIRNNDPEKISKLLSPPFLSLKDFNLQSTTNEISQFIKGKELIVLDQYHTIISSILGKEPSFPIVPSFSDNKLIISNLKFYTNESYNLFLLSTNPGWQHVFLISFGKYEEGWKINILQIGVYSINGLSAPKLYKLGKEALDKGRLTSAMVYSWAIKETLRPAPFLQYMKDKKYQKFIKASYDKFTEKFKFPFTLSGKKFIGLQVLTTDSDGLLPTVLYLTEEDLHSTKVDSEVKDMEEEVLGKFYGIDHDFNFLLMRAYNEVPSDPNKKYELRGTVLRFNEKK